MKAAVCCKFVPDAEDVSPAPDGSINLATANWGVSDYDLNAVQAAADMGVEECVAITAGGSVVVNGRLAKTLLSHGNLTSLHRIVDDSIPSLDTAALAKVLAAAVKNADVDVALFGEGSADRYQRATGAQVAAELGWPCVTFVDGIEVDGDSLACARDLEDGAEEVRVQTPCVLVVTSSINSVSVPGMKAVLAAGKKPIEQFSLADLVAEASPATERVSVHVPEMPGRQRIVLEGSPEEAAEALVDKLRADGIL